MSHVQRLFDFAKTDFTKTIHDEVYPAISPTRPELSQAGRAILVSGGGINLGLRIAQAFVRARANTVVIIGRRFDVLEDARSCLEKQAKAADTNTKIIARACDITDQTQVDALWKELNDTLGIVIDVFVANAAKPPQPKGILEAGIDDIWSQVEVNAKAPLYLTEKFNSQPGDKQKVGGPPFYWSCRPQNVNQQLNSTIQFIVNVSSASIHYYTHPAVAARPGTTLSKTTGTLLFQLIAMENSHEKLQVISYNPGLLWNEYFESLGLPREKFDSSMFMRLVLVPCPYSC